MNEIAITVDTNDGDYTIGINQISDENLLKLKPLIEAIKNFEPYTVKSKGLDWTHRNNFPCGECLPRTDLGEKSPEEIYDFSEDTIELLREFCPWGEYGFHSITKIEVYPMPVKTKLL